ncbi:MarR family winged helix-turn-helix transcriptional regulator [Streptomyces iranensis]|uniref:DNA-binding MarR family transcriptional regulator n=1 Tax=Streptomyces iranensis TaxID=576784 RepID=A0A061A8M9_9ACTN|nr:MarR family transcriptional regulator [Streptomyces iranensis]MBP2060040.1 DNA-binding MarR family transcriptional regulator [Streptomyces iranensis]CDR14178.1 transcriptional regulator, MarR family [Streptomyces iranensis]
MERPHDNEPHEGEEREERDERDDETVRTAARAWQGLNTLLMERHNRRKVVAESLGMSFSRVRALRRLAAAPITLRELAERLGADPPYTSVIVDDLVRRGLAERITNPADRRSKLVHLTEDGKALAARATAILTTPPDALLALPLEDIQALDRVVAKLLD